MFGIVDIMVQAPLGSVRQGQGGYFQKYLFHMYGKSTVDFSNVWFALRRVKDGQREGA